MLQFECSSIPKETVILFQDFTAAGRVIVIYEIAREQTFEIAQFHKLQKVFSFL